MLSNCSSDGLMLSGTQQCNSGDWYCNGSSHGTITFNNVKITYDGSSWRITSGNITMTTWMTTGSGSGAYASINVVPAITTL